MKAILDRIKLKQKAFMHVALTLSELSTCLRKNVGCVLVDKKGRILSTGYNGVASKQKHCTIDNPCPGTLYDSGEGLDKCEALHAEQNALLQCSDTDKIWACYCTTQPCIHCTKLLLNTGCQIIYYHQPYAASGAHLWDRVMEQI